MEMYLRHLCESDYLPILRIADKWWGGRAVSHLFHRLFFVHFQAGSFVLENDEGVLLAFLIGLRSQSNPAQAYIHLIGVDPQQRGTGLGRQLYEHFFIAAREWGCTEVCCITALQNRASIAFHQRLGFQVLAGDDEVDGIAVMSNYDGYGGKRVQFLKLLS